MGIEVVSGAITAAIAVVVGIIGALSQWLTYRRSLVDPSDEIAQDLAVVHYWEEWLRVRLLNTPAGEVETLQRRVAFELDQLPTFADRRALQAHSHAPNELQKSLLFYPAKGLRFFLARMVFYFSALGASYTILFAGAVFVNELPKLTTYRFVSFGMLGVIGMAAAATLIAVLAHALARWFSPPPVAPPLTRPLSERAA